MSTIVKIKNNLNKHVNIKLFNDVEYKLSKDEEIIAGEFNKDKYDYIYNYLKQGLEVFKVDI